MINAILQSTPSISTNSPLASIVPLAFVVLLGMLREALADIRRWREDRRTNARLYTRLENPHDLSQKKQVRSDDLRVGDLLEIKDGETIPADCLLIATQQANHQCFVQTSSLDGEKNLKPKIAIGTIQDTLSSLLKDGGKIEVCAPIPDRNLY